MVPLLEARELVKEFKTGSRGWFRAVDGVSFTVHKGETLAIVGESGSGKSTTARLVLRLLPATSGSVLYYDTSSGSAPVDLLRIPLKEMRAYRRRLQIVFQDPTSALNPRMNVGSAIAEPLFIHRIVPNKRAAAERVAQLLELVGLQTSLASRYPHELSGGQRQRVCIARAIATQPELIVADEPVSALDVSIRAQIINLMLDLQEQLGLSYLFISHDLALVSHISRRVAVMHRGKIVEEGPTERVLSSPAHPYTQRLVSAVPLVNKP
jgi:peptide/nickel transport system ATP-binding protein